jgi:hypothetical protein
MAGEAQREDRTRCGAEHGRGWHARVGAADHRDRRPVLQRILRGAEQIALRGALSPAAVAVKNAFEELGSGELRHAAQPTVG